MAVDPDFKADLARYPRRPFFNEQSIWAILIYRYGRRALSRKPGLARNILLLALKVMSILVETITGIGLSLESSDRTGTAHLSFWQHIRPSQRSDWA